MHPSTCSRLRPTLSSTAPEMMTTPAAPGSVDIKLPSLVSGADDLTVAMKFYDPNGAATLSQVSAASSTSKTVQDGVRAGQIIGVGMGDEGKVIARYDSGEERVIAQLGVAITSNPGSMQDAGNNLFRPGVDTADMVDGVAGAGGRRPSKGRRFGRIYGRYRSRVYESDCVPARISGQLTSDHHHR